MRQTKVHVHMRRWAKWVAEDMTVKVTISVFLISSYSFWDVLTDNAFLTDVFYMSEMHLKRKLWYMCEIVFLLCVLIARLTIDLFKITHVNDSACWPCIYWSLFLVCTVLAAVGACLGSSTVIYFVIWHRVQWTWYPLEGIYRDLHYPSWACNGSWSSSLLFPNRFILR